MKPPTKIKKNMSKTFIFTLIQEIIVVNDFTIKINKKKKIFIKININVLPSFEIIFIC